MGPNGRTGAVQPTVLQGWSSGELPFKTELAPGIAGAGEPSTIEGSMVVQLVPLGALVLGMAIATTDDKRIPEAARAVPLTWVARIPRLTLAASPLEAMGMETVGKFAQWASMQFAGAIASTTTPALEQDQVLGNG